MEFLIAAVVLLMIFVLLGLLLILGITRRLRSHSERLADLEQHKLAVNSLPAGTTIGDFAVTDVNGQPVTREWLAGTETVVAFITYGCPSCKAQLPALREHAEKRGRVLAVACRVPGEEPDLDAVRAALGDTPVIVEEPFGGPAQVAFRAESYPSFFLVGADGSPLATSSGLSDLLRLREPQHVTASAR